MKFIDEAPPEVIEFFEAQTPPSELYFLLEKWIPLDYEKGLPVNFDLKTEIPALLSKSEQNNSNYCYLALNDLQSALDANGEKSAQVRINQFFEEEKQACRDYKTLERLLTDQEINPIWKKLKKRDESESRKLSISLEFAMRVLMAGGERRRFENMTSRETDNYREQVATMACQLAALVDSSDDLDRFTRVEEERLNCIAAKKGNGQAMLPTLSILLKQLAGEALHTDINISNAYLLDPDYKHTPTDNISTQNTYKAMFNKFDGYPTDETTAPIRELEYRQQVVDLAYKLAGLVSQSSLTGRDGVVEKDYRQRLLMHESQKAARYCIPDNNQNDGEHGKDAEGRYIPFPPPLLFYDLLKKVEQEAESLKPEVERDKPRAKHAEREYFRKYLYRYCDYLSKVMLDKVVISIFEEPL